MWAGVEGGGDAASGGERDPTSGPRARAAASGQGAKGGESPPRPGPLSLTRTYPQQSDSEIESESAVIPARAAASGGDSGASDSEGGRDVTVAVTVQV